MLLYRRDERLDEEHVALPAVGLELHFEYVVGEAVDLYGVERSAQLGADLLGQLGVGTATENRDVSHDSHIVATGTDMAWQRPRES
ncbi:hypothetical protein GCM10020001_054120 [Nonomuraea salmonea]